MPLLFDQPVGIPEVVREDRLGIGMTWTAWDGTVWDLRNASQGLFLSREGLRGLTLPPVDRYTSSSPALAGSSWRGYRVAEREAYWNLFVYAGASQEWIDLDRKLWDSFHPSTVGVWTVTQPNGVQRSIRLRCVDDNDHAFPRDPAYNGWALYGISLVAEDPYWEGDVIERSWAASSSVNYFGSSAGFGPPYYIASSASVSTATINNPGDVDAWMQWKISGPGVTSATLGIGSNTVTVPIALGVGQWVTLDTSPNSQVAVDNTGADRTLQLGSANWSPIPAGESVHLNLSITGTGGSISGSLVPRYLRAW